MRAIRTACAIAGGVLLAACITLVIVLTTSGSLFTVFAHGPESGDIPLSSVDNPSSDSVPEPAAGSADIFAPEAPPALSQPQPVESSQELLSDMEPPADLPMDDAPFGEPAASSDDKDMLIALTFDDGPSSAVTPQVLDALKEYDARATFFLVGQEIPGREAIVKRAYDEGHEIANHTMNHKDLTTISAEEVRSQVEGVNDLVEAITGERCSLVRPPYGALTVELRSGFDYPMILWSVDTRDWDTRDPQSIIDETMANVAEGYIVLMHDIHDCTAQALPEMLAQLSEQGYRFVTVSELFEAAGESLDPGGKYRHTSAD